MSAQHNLTAIIRDKRGMVLSIGKNSYTKSHPLMFKYGSYNKQPKKIYLHAEVDAIVKCNHLDKAYSIEVYRLYRFNIYRPSKPCCICLTAIQHTPIKYISYLDKNNVHVTIPSKLIKSFDL